MTITIFTVQTKNTYPVPKKGRRWLEGLCVFDRMFTELPIFAQKIGHGPCNIPEFFINNILLKETDTIISRASSYYWKKGFM